MTPHNDGRCSICGAPFGECEHSFETKPFHECKLCGVRTDGPFEMVLHNQEKHPEMPTGTVQIPKMNKPPPPPTRLIPKGMGGTCGTVVDDLAGRLATMDTIYAVVKDMDGTSHVYWKGTLEGVTFALLMLQDAALDALNGR